MEHFLLENEEILPAAGDALAAGDLDAFGRLADASQRGAERLLGNQVPQTIHLAASARRHGAAAASAFGAGFGGSVWALIEAERAGRFLADWSEDYAGAFAATAPRADTCAAFFSPSPIVCSTLCINVPRCAAVISSLTAGRNAGCIRSGSASRFSAETLTLDGMPSDDAYG